MAQPTTKPCVDCGTPVTKRPAGKRNGRTRPWLCIPCAAERCRVSALQIHHREGEHYERWAAGMRDWARNL